MMYVCPHIEICPILDDEPSKLDCPHSVPHDPDMLGDNCTDEPCPELYDVINGDHFCIEDKDYEKRKKVDKIFECKLEKDLFEI
jgi:hypothetical protein